MPLATLSLKTLSRYDKSAADKVQIGHDIGTARCGVGSFPGGEAAERQ